MTSRREFESPISLGLLRVPQPFVRSHLGIEYAGEVIIADRWRDEWGAPLQGAIYFRIVFLMLSAFPANLPEDTKET